MHSGDDALGPDLARARSIPFVVGAAVLPVSFVLYVSSLFMYVAQMQIGRAHV